MMHASTESGVPPLAAWGESIGWFMAPVLPSRTLCLIVLAALLAASPAALSQEPESSRATALPDAPSVARSSATLFTVPAEVDHPSKPGSGNAEILYAFVDAARSPVTSYATAISGHEVQSDFADLDDLHNVGTGHSAAFLSKYLSPAAVKRSRSFRPAPDGSLMHRATYAASSILIQRDAAGNKHLNTSYLLSVIASTAADSASRPYWRRSPGQPFSDFGSTVGNDAGMNVFHQFQPALRELVKAHEPRFITSIQSKIESKIAGASWRR